ncbi:hypothetical protein ACHAPU_005575 [Fusarium lateritium]
MSQRIISTTTITMGGDTPQHEFGEQTHAESFKSYRDRFEHMCERLSESTENLYQDCVGGIKKAADNFTSFLPGGKAKAEVKRNEQAEDFLEGGRDYKAKMAK